MQTSLFIPSRGARCAALLAAALWCCADARAQLPAAAPLRQDRDAVGGMLVNQTVSALGVVFFREFAEAWRDKPDADSYTLTIIETLSRRFGNQIFIVNGQQRVLTMTLPYRYDRIRPLAEQAAEAASANLTSLLIPAAAGSDPDLAANEF